MEKPSVEPFRKQIVVVDPATGKLHSAEPLTFAEMGVKERQHIEEWIKHNTGILGSKLLLITSEYDKFDKSDVKLDLLALAQDGKLFVVELKRDAKHTLADLQAIRYAAYCSTMTFEQAVKLRAAFAKTDQDSARQEIRDFVGDDDFSKIEREPGIILAAGGFDEKLTSCALWLHKFGLDIRCVEVTPYRLEEGKIILVPRVIIPLPEAGDYMVRAEEKEIDEIALSKTKGLQMEFWTAFIKYCSGRSAVPGLCASGPPASGCYTAGFPLPHHVLLQLIATAKPAGLRCQLVIRSPDSMLVYERVERHKQEIDAILGARLKWLAPPSEGLTGRVFQSRAGDIEARDKWDEYFAWLLERAEAFYKAFLPTLQEVDRKVGAVGPA